MQMTISDCYVDTPWNGNDAFKICAGGDAGLIDHRYLLTFVNLFLGGGGGEKKIFIY